MTTEDKLIKIEQQMREYAIAIKKLHKDAKELLNTGSWHVARQKHNNMLSGIIDYLQEAE